MLNHVGDSNLEFVHSHPARPELEFEDIVEVRPVHRQDFDYTHMFKDMANVVWDLECELVDDLSFFCEMEGGYKIKALARLWGKTMMYIMYCVRWKLFPIIFRTVCKY